MTPASSRSTPVHGISVHAIEIELSEPRAGVLRELAGVIYQEGDDVITHVGSRYLPVLDPRWVAAGTGVSLARFRELRGAISVKEPALIIRGHFEPVVAAGVKHAISVNHGPAIQPSARAKIRLRLRRNITVVRKSRFL